MMDLTQYFLPHNARLLWRSIYCGVNDKRVSVMPGCCLVSGGGTSSVCTWGMTLMWAARMSSKHSSFIVCACRGAAGALTLRGYCCGIVLWAQRTDPLYVFCCTLLCSSITLGLCMLTGYEFKAASSVYVTGYRDHEIWVS